MIVNADRAPEATKKISPAPGVVNGSSRNAIPSRTDAASIVRAVPRRTAIRPVTIEATTAASSPVIPSSPIAAGPSPMSRTRNTIVIAPIALWNITTVATLSAIARKIGCRNR
jgi:hypothetical protein